MKAIKKFGIIETYDGSDYEYTTNLLSPDGHTLIPFINVDPNVVISDSLFLDEQYEFYPNPIEIHSVIYGCIETLVFFDQNLNPIPTLITFELGFDRFDVHSAHEMLCNTMIVSNVSMHKYGYNVTYTVLITPELINEYDGSPTECVESFSGNISQYDPLNLQQFRLPCEWWKSNSKTFT